MRMGLHVWGLAAEWQGEASVERGGGVLGLARHWGRPVTASDTVIFFSINRDRRQRWRSDFWPVADGGVAQLQGAANAERR